MPAGKALLTLSAVLACLVGVQAGLDVSSDKNVAVYWGKLPTARYSYGTDRTFSFRSELLWPVYWSLCSAALVLLLPKSVPFRACRLGQIVLTYTDPDIDVFQLSFLTVINGAGGVPETNFANAGDNCTTFGGTNLLNCPQIQ